uniref:UDP-3-O-acyl-N-acetylglucosamine deacetylase n=1 Tax=Cyanidium caldarium TaxID=2771 RepID=LPXC_CYACA|nr:UDP-3-0-acyl N-acetylglucosamine deacetylase [Cyanidium caldarium]Q9TLX3.1 RecName: Full=UDP-3-O-acyl-N-acetylglucosamine deacetylase; Short=UDP-3-O-acyl-GlcNAc deacetylase; AltName: Full=UDP-3-O-[R-3-hydroxymyristoyl]-N-acetylglucosamine deacetylase [Cyanidium caldarium]AAF12949.1 unknown [Cyanidium caldarium]WDB00268.1 UDP-3-0-acyl N-acetylglucosamine deacetylase [Cyanidium caldarium]
MYNYTIYHPVKISGRGLYTGINSTITIYPELPHVGIYFLRTDLTDYPIVPIIPSTLLVLNSKLSTVLGFHDDYSIMLIEHLMSAISLSQLTDLKIILEGPEIPILDGSSIIWLKLLQQAKIYITSLSNCIIFKSSCTFFIQTKDTFIISFPYTSLAINTGIDFKNCLAIKSQWITILDLLINRFELVGIASSRTFGDFNQINILINEGFFQGANLYNALAFQLGNWCNGPLRFICEPAKHKVLDLIGDLRLLGVYNMFFLIGYKTNHFVNSQLVQFFKKLDK